MKPVPLDTLIESGRLTQSALLEFYEVDVTPFGGDLLRFFDGTNTQGQNLVWKGHEYQAYPVKATGFSLSGKGPSNRPKLTLSNFGGTLVGLNRAFADLVGCKVTRRQVYLKFLDAVNFAAGNPQADPTQEVVSRFEIERLVNIDRDFAAYEMALPSEVDGALIPARMITTDVCASQYRAPECGYTGGPCADENDNPTADPDKDKCGKRLASCKKRFGAHAELPFGGFPSAARI